MSSEVELGEVWVAMEEGTVLLTRAPLLPEVCLLWSIPETEARDTRGGADQSFEDWSEEV